MSTKSVRFMNVPSSFGGGEGNMLSKIKQMTSNISLTTVLIVISIFILIGVSIYYYHKYVSSKFKPSYAENNELTQGSSGASNEAHLLLFYVDWCPHCKTAKPVWEELKSEYENKTINGYKVIFSEINCTNESPEIEEMIRKYKIEGYPTIKLIKDGQVIEYDAKPTKATLEQFLNTVL